MNQYFKDFETKLQVAEEKLDILSEWHANKGHTGAAEVADECRTAITSLWIEFYRLSEAYKAREAEHEAFFDSNVTNLLDELKRYDDEVEKRYMERHGQRPNYLLYDFLAKGVRNWTDPDRQAIDNTTNIWYYLRSLIVSDLRSKETKNHE
ncbi:hypothetical protein [Streptococcus merionis]|uniref:hypothetical protein n=1 Tax=Streptococcus merionis TaxID=400065 RepID=UPI0026EDCF92|nr:hypothetical protein [Streptococcus merionis]